VLSSNSFKNVANANLLHSFISKNSARKNAKWINTQMKVEIVKLVKMNASPVLLLIKIVQNAKIVKS